MTAAVAGAGNAGATRAASGAGDHPCSVCGKAHAPFGLRLPGLRSELPKGKRGYAWACSQACFKILEDRRAAYLGGLAAPAPVDKESLSVAEPAQPDLLAGRDAG